MTGVIETFPLLTNYQTDTESPPTSLLDVEVGCSNQSKGSSAFDCFPEGHDKDKEGEGEEDPTDAIHQNHLIT